MPIKLNTASGGGVILTGANTASDKTITVPAVDATMLTDSSGVLNIGSGQVYKDASGKVGIGTTAPRSELAFSNSYPGTTGTPNKIRIYDDGGSVIFGFGLAVAQLTYNSGDGAHVFYSGGASPTERARIDNSGNLLVGTTNATLYNQGAGVTGLKLSGTNCQMASTGTLFDFNNTSGGGINAINWWYRGGNVGNILVNTASTAYNTTSDYRLKENVQPMTGALAKVAALKPCTYTWKVNGEASQGFIAHELQEVVPECVSGEKDAVNEDGSIKPQGIDTSFLVATLTAAIQEQQQMIETLQAKVAALEAK